ncbi:hypothetical protein H109_00151 [Trichophyton interdigitale MR816]|uniref:Extracellular membrane protein CFEM domain-containing protein n=1 Tax=Trichophyton interdigitale (strain MR816) TaxID=1215338 RepID=A0A059JJN9_TRIIM|nr:hypothetical protein H101_01379 [Trichophyton interdigitale H6]KDB28101.1 hypothetical protein H109_00151 [Trichophyton interdigitale MR816]
MLKQCLYYLLGSQFFVTLILANGPVSIDQAAGYSSQRHCAQSLCFEGSLGSNRVGYELGCPSPLMNDCFCRLDLQVSATSFLSSCVNNHCESNTIDLTQAINIYTGYCANAGYKSGGATPSSSSSGQTTAEETPTQTHTVPVRSSSWETPTFTGTTPSPEPTSGLNSPNSINPPEKRDEDKLRGGEIAGIVVGILGFIATAAGVYFSYRMLKNKKQRRATSPEMASVY